MRHHYDDIRHANAVARMCGRRLGWDRLPARADDLDEVADFVLRLTPQELNAVNLLGVGDFITVARVAIEQLALPGLD